MNRAWTRQLARSVRSSLCGLVALALITNTLAAQVPAGAAAAPAPATTAASGETRQELEEFVGDYNDLFPAAGIKLSTTYERSWIEGQRFTEIQQFTGNFRRVAPDTYEQYGNFEKLTFADDQLKGMFKSKLIHRLMIENGKIALYAIYTDSNGNSNEFGPTDIQRLGNCIAFHDSILSPTEFDSSRFYRHRDGSLGSSRHWDFPVGRLIDTWRVSPPSMASTQ